MIYYCIYKNECSYKECIYRETKSKFSAGHGKQDLTIDGFDCIMVGSKTMRLISDERIICDRYRECIINCPLKTIYLTPHNFGRYFGYKFRQPQPFKCLDIGETVNLQTAGENVGNYISIWNQPNLFSKKVR
jgi:hypothetical protein